MGFLTGLFGGETNIWTILLALIIVIALIFFGVWILKLIFKASVTIAGGRKRRLAMVDSLAIDNKRNVILIRRDNVEHLIMVSNTGELLIEGSIPVGSSASELKTNSELNVPAAPKNDRKTPSLDAKAPAIVAGGVAAAGLAVGGVAVMGASKQNSDASARPQNTPAQKFGADRLGLARLLRRKDEPRSEEPKSAESAPILATQKSLQPQKNIAAVTPIASASASAQTIISAALKTAPSDAQTSKTAPVFSNNTVTPLRTTGILKPISEMVGNNSEIAAPQNTAQNINEITDSSIEDSFVDNETVVDSPVESSPVVDSPVEYSLVEGSPLEKNSVEIDVTDDIADKSDENGDKKNKTIEMKSTHGDELKSTETSKMQSKEAKDIQKTEEVTSNEQDNIKAISPDSAKNKVQQIDAKAMESIEEGTNSGDDGAKSSKKASDSGSAKDPKSNEKAN